MKVIEEAITILRHDGDQGLTLLMGGYRLALSMDEARVLVNTVRAALPGVLGDGGKTVSSDAAARATDSAALVAKVTDQVISWAQIADAAQRK
jgi:hypothetical protein